MAHHVEPMDIDSDFDNKENSLHHNNVLPFTEKGYEELDVSELNMKLRYSITPASSPMSRSCTADCLDNKTLELSGGSLNVTVSENNNLTRSLNSTMTKSDSNIKSLKTLPLQALPTDQFVESNRSSLQLRPHDATITQDFTVTISGPSDIDENMSLPSSSSSVVHTPEATTPTKDIPKSDGSPIMRGLKSVLSMFRSSQSPIPPTEGGDIVKPEILSPVEVSSKVNEHQTQAMLASTPLAAHRKKEASPTKRSSPNRDSIVFNDDLEKELQWKDETTILFSQERIPIHKLLYPQPQAKKNIAVEVLQTELQDDMDSTTEYMDISCNDSIRDRTMTDVQASKIDCTVAGESDSEFVDCETTFTKNASIISEDKDKTPIVNETHQINLTTEEKSNENVSASRLKQIILNTTQDILDATLSITPEDLIPQALDNVSSSISSHLETINTNLNVCDAVAPENLNTTVDKIESPTDNETNSTVNVETEELNITSETKEYMKLNVLDQTVDIVPSPNTEMKEDPNATQTLENIPVQSEIQVKIFDSTVIKDENATLTSDNNETNLVLQSAQENELNKTVEITAIVTENIEAMNASPAPFSEAITKPLPIDEIKTSPLESLMTALPVDIPLPDEDDTDKDVPDSTTGEVPTSPDLPLDLVDDIQVNSESPNIVDSLPSEKIEVKLTENVNTTFENLSSEMVLPKNIPINYDDTRNQVEGVQSEADLIQEVKLSDANYEKPISDDPQNKESGVLPEILPVSTQVNKEQSNVPEAMEALNVTNNVTYSDNAIATASELMISEDQDVVPMDINESINELKPLPDIINQTITMANAENVDQVAFHELPQVGDVLPVSRNIEQDESNEPCPEIIPDAGSKDVPELISDVVTAPSSDTTNVTADIVPTDVPIAKTDKETTLPITETCPTVTSAIVEHTAMEIQTEHVAAKTKTLPSDTNECSEKDKVKAVDEEIVLSENNSPFVSVIAENISETNAEETGAIKNIEDEFISKAKINNPPPSPPIASKGYNFNFDEIDDPFATKTNIRMSPPLDTPAKAVGIKTTSKTAEKPVQKKDVSNRRRSQSERKKPVAYKRKFDSTFDGAVHENTDEKAFEKFAAGDIIPEPPINVALDSTNVIIDEDKFVPDNTQNTTKEILKSELTIEQEDKIELSPIVDVVKSIELNMALSKELKTTSSSEQSTYFSAGSSSNESIHTKNVFNLPEIDDVHFNPFVTKSKMRQSPPPGSEIENSGVTNNDITYSPKSSIMKSSNEINLKLDTTHGVLSNEKIEIEQIEKEAFENLSNTTTSSKSTEDRNVTTRDINTEDEDTIEGPFLESEDLLNAEGKLSDFEDENIDMMQFHDLPVRKNDENLDTGELFIDAEAFEFLLNQNQSNTIADSGKESLFLKFDPLFAKRMSSVASDSVVAALGKLQKKQSTPTKTATPPQKEVLSPIAGPSNLNVTQELYMNMSEEYNEDLNITVSKPMMVVPPAVNPVTPRNKSLTPNRSNRRSITFTSPAMAVIDRLLSLSGNNSSHETTPVQVSREQTEADIALSQLRELLAEKEIHVYTLRNESKELKERLTTLESHLRNLEVENQDRLKKINDLNDRLAEKTKMNKSMAAVVEEYERTIATLVAEKAQTEKRNAEEKIKLINERDEQIAHLASMEGSFNDLHSKYEKSKQILLNCKANEDAYMKSINNFEENLTKMQKNYELLKQHATSKLNHANQELEKMSKLHEVEILKLNAMIKRKELHIASLEESLTQKTKANEELTAIFDELINKVG